MTRAQKLRKRILAKPTPADVTSAELAIFFKQLGLEEIQLGKTSGSRIKFANPRDRSQQIRLHKSHGSSPIDRGALQDVIKKLKKMGLL